MSLEQLVTPGTGLVAIIAAIAAFVRWVLPRWRRFTDKLDAGFESIVGRDAIVDPASGRELAPAVPGIGVRMTNVEDAVALLVANGQRLDDHDARIRTLEEASIERIVTRADSALAWKAIRAAVENQPAEPPTDEAIDSLEDLDTEP